MNYIIDETKFKHTMWGEGVLRSLDGTIITVEFPQVGIKKLTVESIQNGILTVVNTTIANHDAPDDVITPDDCALQQYDSSDMVVGGKNILEAFETDDVVIFNESYTVIGDKTTAKKISATYDLTIIGDVAVDEIKVNGNLTILGDLSAKMVSCSNALICQGDIRVDNLYVGSIVAKSIKCLNFVCDGNALIETTIDIDESSRTEKTMVACEGIMGAGSFMALNAIANEYFEFSGDVHGKVLELESDTTISETHTPEQPVFNLFELSLKDVIAKIEERLQEEYSQCGNLEEDSLKELTELLGANSLHTLSDFAPVFETLTKISYEDEIDDFGSYLMVIYARKILPREIYQYETIEHIDTLILPKAEETLAELEFNPCSVEHIAQCIKIAVECADDIPMPIDEVLDKIFSSFGIRFSTVKRVLVNAPHDLAPTPRKPSVSKTEFLSASIQSKAKAFGLTSEEQVRLLSARIKTCGEFLQMTEQELRDLFRKKLFLADHLFKVQQKMRIAFEEIGNE